MTRAVGADAFASSLEEIFGDIERVSERALEGAVRDGAKTSRDEWSERAPKRTGDYAKSIKYRVDRTGPKPEAHVYSTKPGLPHLLEKGHATIGGGKVPPHPHVADAATAGFDAAMESLESRLDRGL